MAEVTFRYNRAPTGELSGESLVEQTEEALSGLGQSSSHAEEEAARAVEIATAADGKADQAVATAGQAQSTANSALTTAQSAQSSATQAVQTAQSAVTTAQGATQTAQNAVSTAQSAVTAAQSAQTAAENAESRASTSASAAEGSASSASAAQTAAETAQANADNASGLATQAQAAAAQSAQDAQAAAASVAASARQIGEIISSALPLNSAGLHLLDGTLLDGDGIYADFVTYIAALYTADPTAAYFTDETTWQQSITDYGVCGKFVYDSVANTVRLPKLTGIVEGTTDLTALGDLIQAGLPNLYGTTFLASSQNYATKIILRDGGGVFDSGNSHSNIMSASNSGDNTQQDHLIFNANKYNPIYGNSTTVQPQTIKTLVYIVIATVTKTEVQVDIDNVVTELNRLNSNTVQVDHAQAFSDGQKSQARINIGAVSYESQTLTETQKAQARANINAEKSAVLSNLGVTYITNDYVTADQVGRCGCCRYGNLLFVQININPTSGKTYSDMVAIGKIPNAHIVGANEFCLETIASQDGHVWLVGLYNISDYVSIKVYSVGTSTSGRIAHYFIAVVQ